MTVLSVCFRLDQRKHHRMALWVRDLCLQELRANVQNVRPKYPAEGPELFLRSYRA
jgi:hypothetical protein